MTRVRGARVLVVEDDLDQHKVIRDIIDICLKDAKIDRVMTTESFLAKVRAAQPQYTLIFYDLNFHAEDGPETLAAVREEVPGLEKHLILLVNSIEEYNKCAAVKGLQYIIKPFSLDNFSEIVKHVCGR